MPCLTICAHHRLQTSYRHCTHRELHNCVNLSVSLCFVAGLSCSAARTRACVRMCHTLTRVHFVPVELCLSQRCVHSLWLQCALLGATCAIDLESHNTCEVYTHTHTHAHTHTCKVGLYSRYNMAYTHTHTHKTSAQEQSPAVVHVPLICCHNGWAYRVHVWGGMWGKAYVSLV